MKHTIANGVCSVCGPVKAVLVRSVGRTLQRCPNQIKEKKKAARQNERQRATKAIKRTKTKRQHDAEYLWRQIVFERAGRKCEVCGKPFEKGDFQLQAHHLVKRSQSSRLRLDPVNGLALCAGHHQYADRDTTWAIAIADELRPGTAKHLLRERRLIGRQDIDIEETILEQAWFALQST